MSENPEMFQSLLNDYEEIRINLERELSGADKTALYMNLNKLIIKIADYICRNEKTVRKGIGEIMGGRILDLESERLLRPGKEKGEEKAKLNIAKKMLERSFSLEDIQFFTGLSREELEIF